MKNDASTKYSIVVIISLSIIIIIQYQVYVKQYNFLRDEIQLLENNIYHLETHARKLVEEPDGVAVTMFLGSPQWFQNRYSMMINQILSIIPTTWKVQIIFNPRKRMSVEATQYPGIQRQFNRGRVIFTELPVDLQRKKKKDIMTSKWLWESIISDNVLFFGGNAVLCSNSPNELNAIIGKYDYIGAAWHDYNGVGGNGALSIRNRTKILSLLEQLGDSSPRHAMGSEDSYFVKALQNDPTARLASMEETERFALSDHKAIGKPFGAVGTLSSLNDVMRQKYLDYCPEMKMMFPSLHNPSCFGAEPNAIGCFQYLCEYGGLKCSKNKFIKWLNQKNSTVSIQIAVQ